MNKLWFFMWEYRFSSRVIFLGFNSMPVFAQCELNNNYFSIQHVTPIWSLDWIILLKMEILTEFSTQMDHCCMNAVQKRENLDQKTSLRSTEKVIFGNDQSKTMYFFSISNLKWVATFQSGLSFNESHNCAINIMNKLIRRQNRFTIQLEECAWQNPIKR